MKPTGEDAEIPGATSVPGVWVAGSVAGSRSRFGSLAAAGADVAAAISADLIAEDTYWAVSAHHPRDPFSAEVEQQVSDLVMGDRRHGL